MEPPDKRQRKKAPVELQIEPLIDSLQAMHYAMPTDTSAVEMAEENLHALCQRTKEVFLEQPMMPELDAPMRIAGDIHGQYFDLLRLFHYGGNPSERNYLFLGDYVDRGKNSIECIVLLFAYKVKFPENFFLLRGNHECENINRQYGFFDECKRRFTVKLWKTFGDAFNNMPVCACVADRILCMHGGLSPELTSLDQVRQLPRPCDIPDAGLLADLLWADPSEAVQDWGENDRGVSFTFGAEVVRNFLAKHQLDLIARAHQVVEDGYEFFANRKLVTVFSAPNYMGEFDNCGALMIIEGDLTCSFKVMKPRVVGPRARPLVP
eukprot:TRINITY_DN36418_c0_g2_i1.p2 TRINITY_DN36418_c0_g2~~TRINITY_DN36418_c0_g2_i1.p2  ORF type:complete len:322 (-),score=86.79 TRINITY_DN36418_c0_g2_i1:79-1044(-)